MDLLNDVTRELPRNMGGGRCELYLALHSDILEHPAKPEDDDSVSMEDLAKLSGNYQMKDGKKFITIRAIEDTVLIQDEEIGEIDGMSYQNSVTFSVAGQDAIALGLGERTLNRKVVVLAPDKMGRVRAIGSASCGAFKLAQTSGTGTAAADRAMKTFQFAYYDFGPAPIYAGNIPLNDGSGSGSGV